LLGEWRIGGGKWRWGGRDRRRCRQCKPLIFGGRLARAAASLLPRRVLGASEVGEAFFFSGVCARPRLLVTLCGSFLCVGTG